MEGRPAAAAAAAGSGYFDAYAAVGLLAVVGVLFVAVSFTANRLMRHQIGEVGQGDRRGR